MNPNYPSNKLGDPQSSSNRDELVHDKSSVRSDATPLDDGENVSPEVAKMVDDNYEKLLYKAPLDVSTEHYMQVQEGSETCLNGHPVTNKNTGYAPWECGNPRCKYYDTKTEPTCPTCGKGNTGLSVCSDSWHFVQPPTDIRAAIRNILSDSNGDSYVRGVTGTADGSVAHEKYVDRLEALLNTQLAAERAALLAALPDKRHYTQYGSLGFSRDADNRTKGFNDCLDTITNLIKERDTV